MTKYCILYDNKVCTGCGECDVCDLDPGKLCNNCGKCLDGYDYNAIQIDDLIAGGTNKGLNQEIDADYSGDRWRFNKNKDIDDKDFENTLFIDDIEGLSEEIEHHDSHITHDHNHSHTHAHGCDCDHDGNV